MPINFLCVCVLCGCKQSLQGCYVRGGESGEEGGVMERDKQW